MDYDKKQYIDANKNAEKLFGYTRKEIAELNVGELSPLNQSNGGDSKELAYEYITKALLGESVTYEWIIQRKDGKLVPVEVRFVRLPYSDRTILRSSVIDITERKKAEHLLNSEKKKLQESNTELIALNHQLEEQAKQLQEFAYISSHNLRSPAGNIRALLNFYLSDPTEKNKDLFINKLDTVSQDLLETINDLSEVVKIKNEKNKEVVTIDLKKMLDKAKNSLSEEIQKTNAIITADFAAADKIVSSKAYVESIFLNLISNSLKYNNPEVPLRITIHTEVTEDSFILSFTDNGLGLDLKKFGQKVFGLRKTFHRGKDSRGVGLFLTKAQVEAMGGFISLVSEPMKGCTFSINLPKSILA
jgi:PAS domain S-box-containing protein